MDSREEDPRASVQVALRAVSNQDLLAELARRGKQIEAEGRVQPGRTMANRAQYLLDHMPGAVLLAKGGA